MLVLWEMHRNGVKGEYLYIGERIPKERLVFALFASFNSKYKVSVYVSVNPKNGIILVAFLEDPFPLYTIMIPCCVCTTPFLGHVPVSVGCGDTTFTDLYFSWALRRNCVY